MKYAHKSPILQMFVEGRGTADDLAENTSQLKEKSQEKRRELAVLTQRFTEKLKENEELFALYEELLVQLEEGYGAECDFHYSEGFRFGVLLGLDIAGFIKEE
jgi:hypothetical protein